MTRSEVKEALDRVLTWPPKRQNDVVKVISAMEEQASSTYRLTDEQAAEVRRRLRQKNPKNIPAKEVFKRLRRKYGV